MPPPRVKAGLAFAVFTAIGVLIVALVVIMLFVLLVVVLGFTSTNAELNGVLSTAEKLMDVDEDVGVVVAANVKVLLLGVLLVPKLGSKLLDVVVAGDFVPPKVKVGVANVFAAEGVVFCKDSVFGITGVTDVVAFALSMDVSFDSRVFIDDGMFDCTLVFGVTFGELKVMTGFVLSFASGLDEEKPLGATAAVERGVVLMLVVVVEELRVAQMTEHVTGGVNVALISSACITTSGLILFSAENTRSCYIR